tara:strand:- start:291 stop:605 length:315 start_codon:yes stop_codon:yes gene_type:complete
MDSTICTANFVNIIKATPTRYGNMFFLLVLAWDDQANVYCYLDDHIVMANDLDNINGVIEVIKVEMDNDPDFDRSRLWKVIDYTNIGVISTLKDSVANTLGPVL